MKIQGGDIEKTKITRHIRSNPFNPVAPVTSKNTQAPPGSNHVTIGGDGFRGHDHAGSKIKPPARLCTLNLDYAVGNPMVRVRRKHVQRG